MSFIPDDVKHFLIGTQDYYLAISRFYKAKSHDQTLPLEPLIHSSNELTSVLSPNETALLSCN